MESINWTFIVFMILWFIAVGSLMLIIGLKRIVSSDFETRRLYFAAVTLSGLGFIFVFAIGLYFLSENGSTAGKEIFDASKTIIPPIITLVLGYYFGQENRLSSSNYKALIPTDNSKK